MGPVSNRRVFVFLHGDRCRPCGPKPREAVAPQRRRPAPGRPGEPLPARGRRHHAPGRRQLPRQAPRRRRPGAPARRPRPREARAAVSAAARPPAGLRQRSAQPEYLRRPAAARLLPRPPSSPSRALGSPLRPQRTPRALGCSHTSLSPSLSSNLVHPRILAHAAPREDRVP